ncbi:MAG: SDR family NAD(P)-dependent oxidoreductase [Fluviicoccus sp.]|uniref:SDR family NAD(P)-dependent oxidoreductase n=1 Tax=Fluviicoccus sp. TaxID=2003552 RepID=UPI00271B95D9|nr:SDR family NAD(P)-dependent oxidoreductase [Fluviicoccus sp.]MDO8331892.1 SDR family NAD(P)-dependent oxidoreductase [Fluviicoccus sp.]
MLDWLLEKSLLGYTRVGYAVRHRPDWEYLPRLDGRTVVVTGATGGLGAAAAERLAGLGARVILVGRDAVKLEAMLQRIGRLPGACKPEVESADLSDMKSVAALGRRLVARKPDILLNNAGVLLNRRTETEEGLESTFATNLLGHYILTEILLPTLAGRPGSRVINVSSGGMYTQRIRLDDPETRQMPYQGPEVYARTKRAQVMLTRRWAKRFPALAVFSMHPGWADTTGVQNALPLFRKLTRPVLRSAAEGADTMVWLAASDEPLGASGRFFHDRRVWPEHRMNSTRERPEETEQLDVLLEEYAVRLLGQGWRG